MNKGKALIGVLAGMVAGAIVGVMFAPEKGSDTRKKISRKGDDLVDAVGDRFDKKFDELIAIIRGTAKRSTVNNGSRKETESV